MRKVYAEIGFGNESFFSTEFEERNKEHRIKKFVMPKKVEEVYFRIWIINLMIIISFFKGIFIKRKNKFKIKFVFGFGGKG